jgi:tetratricopeptide (TPR) repeat protein
MATKVAFIKQERNWFALFPNLLVIGILCLCFYQVDKQYFFFIALFLYFLLTLLAKWLFFPNVLYEGIKLIREAKFEEAIPIVQQTIDYYLKKSWIDKYRFWLLISSAKRSIGESSTCNLAYCYLQIGQVNRAKEIYDNVLHQYPDNINAKCMLNTINLVSKEAVANAAN